MRIFFNNSSINDWNFGDDNIIKVYRNGAVVYYKVISSGSTPTYQVCYAVVDDISQYQETEFEDVFNKADDKWYKLNNLNQYEEYGVYGDSISTGSTSRLPQGYTEVEYIENTGTSYINTNYVNTKDTEFELDFQITSGVSEDRKIIGEGFKFGLGQEQSKWRIVDSQWYRTSESVDTNRHTAHTDTGKYYIDETLIADRYSQKTAGAYPMFIFAVSDRDSATPDGNVAYMKMFNCKIYEGETLVRDFIPCINPNNVVGAYDIVNDVFYTSPNGNDFSGGQPVSSAATTYEGKLAIVDGYEYQYSGGSWINVGEVSESSGTLPNVAFSVNYNAKNYDANTKTLAKTNGQLVDVDAVITAGTPTVNDGYLTIASSTRATISGYQTYFNRDNNNPNLTIISKQRTDDSNCHMFANRDNGYNWMYRCYSNKLTLHGSSEQGSVTVTTQPVIESVRIDSNRLATYNNYTNNTSSTFSNFKYGSTNSGKFALFQGYATTSGENFVGDFYWVYMSQNTLTDEQVQQVIAYNEGGGGQTEYPVYYDEKADPLNNLSFSSMTEAQDYAHNNCVYDGMIATIDGDRYYFDSEDEDGWVKVLSYYKVEDVSPDGISGWTITGSSTYNPNSSYYDDFSVENPTTSNQNKIAKVTIFGYDHFTYYLRTSGYSTYAYATATNIDELQTNPSTNINYSSYEAITSTYNWNKAPGAEVNLSNYRRITFNNLDKTVEHTFYVSFYGRTYSSSQSNATILIPKEQSNENWEQVTFTTPATSVSGYSKNLYIDGSNSTNGGSQNWFNRWIVGLPAGSHTSSSNYKAYSYCPAATSSAFTSVAGEKRQVDFTWTTQENTLLRFRLVDTSGNTLTPSSPVYYGLTGYNACEVISSTYLTNFPVAEYLKVNGKMVFGNSNNRHYIYGYSPSITFGAYYNVNDYNTYFDIPYTKLDEEAVTITYTTFDPNDTETPAFNSSITWPYSGGTTSSTTLTSYNVPYTYSYVVEQTSNMFGSTSAQTFTAGQATRTITFTLYPNNREFNTVADMEAYQYAWEGMKAKVDYAHYTYENGEWVFNPYVVPSGYTELTYAQTTKEKALAKSFTVPIDLQATYNYIFEFTPLNWEDNYYGLILGGTDETSISSNWCIFKLDNGWGDVTKRFTSAFWNYNLQTRGSSPGGRYRVYTGVKSKFTMNLHNYTVGEGADIKVENEGYSAYTHTSTEIFKSGYTVETGIYDITVFTAPAYSGYYIALLKFHNLKVEDNQGHLIYDYRPVQRVSDSVVGLFDVVNQEFFYPTDFTLTAGDPV